MEAPAHGEWSAHIGEDITDPEKAPDAAFAQFGDDYARNSKNIITLPSHSLMNKWGES